MTATDTAEVYAKSLHGTLEGRRVNVCRTFASLDLVNFAGARGSWVTKGQDRTTQEYWTWRRFMGEVMGEICRVVLGGIKITNG